MNTKNTWFVTGSSKGLGLVLVQRLLSEGYNVVATTRNLNDLEQTIGEHENFLPLEVNLTEENNVKAAIERAVNKFGSLDAVVNNAGYGLLGAVEELSMNEIRNEFDINVFATINVIRAALPQMRSQRSGHIFNITSIAGWHGDTGANIYNSTKYAVEGLSDALAKDLKPFNIKVTAVAPGPFRTNFLSKGSVIYAKPSIEDYGHIHEHKKWLDKNLDQKQLGDPHKAPDVILKVFKEENPPVHILMGSDAVEIVTSHLQHLLQEIESWKEISKSTDLKNI